LADTNEKLGGSPFDLEFKVGDRVKVNMHRGRIVEAEVKAVIEKTNGVRLQISLETRPRWFLCGR